MSPPVGEATDVQVYNPLFAGFRLSEETGDPSVQAYEDRRDEEIGHILP